MSKPSDTKIGDGASVQSDSDSFDFPLTSPITLDGQTVNYIRYRKPKAGDRLTAMKNAGSNQVSIIIFEVILLCATAEVNGRQVSVTRSALEDLSWQDGVKLENAFFESIGSMI